MGGNWEGKERRTWERKEKADCSSEIGPAMAMNLLFFISFSKLTLSLIVVNAPALLLLLAVTIALFAPTRPTSEAEIRWFNFW